MVIIWWGIIPYPISPDDIDSFQNGVDTIYNGCVTYGSTPTASTPSAIVTAISNIYTNRYNVGAAAGTKNGYLIYCNSNGYEPGTIVFYIKDGMINSTNSYNYYNSANIANGMIKLYQPNTYTLQLSTIKQCIVNNTTRASGYLLVNVTIYSSWNGSFFVRSV